jgi:hypothetical protein
MANIATGRLQKVDLRQVWGEEDTHFTPWLALEQNLSLLGAAIELKLEYEAMETRVGPFKADILCKDTLTNRWVVIENQLTQTDHRHLGQLLTYASGLKACTIIWIAASFTDEHRAAIDWLNEITSNDYNFFGIEIELYQIGDSPVAPSFKIVSKPNNWSKTMSETAKQIQAQELSGLDQIQWEFWTELHSYMLQQKSAVQPQKPQPRQWMNFAIGKSCFVLRANLNSRDKVISVDLLIETPFAKQHFALLESHKGDIENGMGESLLWKPDRGKSCAIGLIQEELDLKDKEQWSQMLEWFYLKLNLMSQVFRPYILSIGTLGRADFKGMVEA